jgi:fucose 4-O-acetylase-like acetyltransferase
MVALDTFTSQKFRFWSFVSMFLLVFVHGYNLEIRYLEPFTVPNEALTPTGFIEYFLANGIFRFRIPMLFAISGYLFALHDEQPQKQRVKKRLKTLLAPYLLWSAFGIGMTYALELLPLTREMIESSRVVQIDNTRTLIHDYHWYEILARWIVFPVSYQLWFIRVLLIYNLAYPLIRQWITGKYSQRVFFPIVFIMWLSTFGLIFIEGEGLLFFSLGVLLQKKNFSLDKPTEWLNPGVWGFVFVVCAAAKTWLAFEGQPLMGNWVFIALILLHKTTVVSGLIACWFGLDPVVRWLMNYNWFVKLSAFSFMIYAMHAPFVAYFISPVIQALQPMAAARLAAFVILPLAIISVCVMFGWLLRAIAPRAYGLLTGGRGM